MTGKPRGFTVLEVLIAVLVLGMVILLLNQGVAFGLRAAATQQRAEDRHGDFEAVDRAIRRLIAEADPGTNAQPAAFVGGPSNVTLVSELPAPPNGAHERVDAALFLSGGQLRLRWTRRLHTVRFGAPPPAQELVLLSGVIGLQLAYFNGGGWATTWSEARLPLLVRITLQFQDANRKWPPIEVAPMREALD